MHCGAVSTAAEQEGVEECQCSHLAVAPQSSCSCGSVMYDSLPKAISACSKQHSSSLACSRHATEEAGRLCQVAGQVTGHGLWVQHAALAAWVVLWCGAASWRARSCGAY